MVFKGQTFLLLLACSIVFIFCTGASAKKQEPLIVHCKGTYIKDGDYFYRRTSPPNSSNTTCMHYAWSTNGSFVNLLKNLSEPIRENITGYPTLLVAHSDSTDICNNKNCDLNGIPALNNSTTPFFMVVVFRRIIEFNITAYPTNKSAINTTKYNCTGSNCASKKFEDMLYKESCFRAESMDDYGSFFLNSSNVKWTSYISTNKTTKGDMVFSGRDISNVNAAFKIDIMTHFPSVFGYDRLKRFPKTRFSENSTTFDIILDHFNYTQSNWHDHSSRLALELIVIHGSSIVNKAEKKFTMDDEYTPSVFSTVTYPVNDTVGGKGGYFQWKPISYQSDGRKSTSSQQANWVYAENNTNCLVGDDPIVRSWFVVIGTEADDTFLNSNYSTWTAVIGYGDIPQDKISFTVIITIIVGLGVPAILVLLGGVYVVIKKKPWLSVKRWASRNKQGYSVLN